MVVMVVVVEDEEVVEEEEEKEVVVRVGGGKDERMNCIFLFLCLPFFLVEVVLATSPPCPAVWLQCARVVDVVWTVLWRHLWVGRVVKEGVEVGGWHRVVKDERF